MWKRGRGKGPWRQMLEKVIRVMKKHSIPSEVIKAVVNDVIPNRGFAAVYGDPDFGGGDGDD